MWLVLLIALPLLHKKWWLALAGVFWLGAMLSSLAMLSTVFLDFLKKFGFIPPAARIFLTPLGGIDVFGDNIVAEKMVFYLATALLSLTFMLIAMIHRSYVTSYFYLFRPQKKKGKDQDGLASAGGGAALSAERVDPAKRKPAAVGRRSRNFVLSMEGLDRPDLEWPDEEVAEAEKETKGKKPKGGGERRLAVAKKDADRVSLSAKKDADRAGKNEMAGAGRDKDKDKDRCEDDEDGLAAEMIVVDADVKKKPPRGAGQRKPSASGSVTGQMPAAGKGRDSAGSQNKKQPLHRKGQGKIRG
jgi:hypothetical protein